MKKSQFLLLCFLPFIGLAQASDAGENSRNLEDRYFHLYDKLVEHQYADLDSASYYADQLLALSKENQDSMWIAAALEGQGYVHYYREEVDQALKKFQLQKKIMLSVAMPGELGLAYMNIANVQSGMGESNKSILNYLEAQKLLPKDSTYDIDRAYLNYNLANNLVEFEDYRSAADYLKKAKEYARQEGITDLIPSIINIEAELSLINKLPNQALKLADSALVQSREVNDMIEELYALELRWHALTA
ncbi:MAG: hypothetical protein U5L96_21370 [Owenweeksia sp.]|nr:hypothetical protein [Owenweeksia sp.]